MPKTITGVEVFRTGTWYPASGGKVTITGEDLDNMVSSFAHTRESLGFRPRLKLGHQESNKFFGGPKGLPNFGFVESLKREGEKLIATFKDVPTRLFDLMQSGRYNTVSIEVLPSVKLGGQEFKSVMTAVAVLGAELPAVKGLAELADVMLAEDEPSDQLTLEGRIMLAQQPEAKDELMSKDAAIFSQDQHQSLVDAAVDKAIAETTAKFEGQIAELNEKVEAGATKLAEAKTALVQLSEAAVTEKVGGLIEDAIKDGRALPAQKDMLFAMGKSMVTSGQEFAAGEDGAMLKGMDAFSAYMNGLQKQIDVDTETGGSDAAKAKPGRFESADAEVVALVAQAQKDAGGADKLDAGTALRQVLMSADEDLKQRYARGE